MKNDIGKYVDVTPSISYDKFAELICLCLAFVDYDSVARLPIDISDVLENIIKKNKRNLNYVLDILDIVAYDNNPVCFKHFIDDAFKKYVNSQTMWVDFSKSLVNIPYESNKEVSIKLVEFGTDIFSQGMSLARMIKDYLNTTKKYNDAIESYNKISSFSNVNIGTKGRIRAR